MLNFIKLPATTTKVTHLKTLFIVDVKQWKFVIALQLTCSHSQSSTICSELPQSPCSSDSASECGKLTALLTSVLVFLLSYAAKNLPSSPTNFTTFQVPCVLNVFSSGILQTWQRRIIDHEAFMYHFYVKLENCQQKRDYTDMKVWSRIHK